MSAVRRAQQLPIRGWFRGDAESRSRGRGTALAPSPFVPALCRTVGGPLRFSRRNPTILIGLMGRRRMIAEADLDKFLSECAVEADPRLASALKGHHQR